MLAIAEIGAVFVITTVIEPGIAEQAQDAIGAMAEIARIVEEGLEGIVVSIVEGEVKVLGAGAAAGTAVGGGKKGSDGGDAVAFVFRAADIEIAGIEGDGDVVEDLHAAVEFHAHRQREILHVEGGRVDAGSVIRRDGD